MQLQMLLDGSDIPGLNLQAYVIHVGRFVIGKVTAFLADRSFRINQVDQRLPGAELGESELTRASFQLAAEDVAVELDHSFQVADTNHDVIDEADVDGIGLTHGRVSLQRLFAFDEH